MDATLEKLTAAAAEKKAVIDRIEKEYRSVIVGQEMVLRRMLNCLLSGGHLLLEGVPGLAKTMAIRTLSKILGLDFKRIQFTPDMLPADIRGTMIYNQNTGSFEVKKGPVFTHFILADEINRAPSKVQSALLESMQERTATIGDTTYILPDPFFVMATQNPIEQEGTYPLPEAQTDRFFMKVSVDYPTLDEEREVMRRMSGMSSPEPKTCVTRDEVLDLQKFCSEIYVDEKVSEYIARIVHATRAYDKNYVKYGASPRASINFMKAVRSEAFFDGRGYVIPEDVKAVAYDILRHRIILTFEAEAEGMTSASVVEKVLNTVEIP